MPEDNVNTVPDTPEPESKPDIFKLHVSFENIYLVEAKDFDQAIEKLREKPFGDILTRQNVTLLETISHETAEKLKHKGKDIYIYGSSNQA